MYMLCSGWHIFLKMSIESNWSIVSFRTSVALLIVYLEDLFIYVNGMLNSPTINVFFQFLLLCLLVFILDMTEATSQQQQQQYLFYVFACSYIQCIYVDVCKNPVCVLILLSLCSVPLYFFIDFVLKSFVWYEYCSTCFFLSFSITWIFSFHPSTFSLCVSFAVRQISCRQNILGSCFSIQPTTLCLLTGAFSPLTFNYWYICIYCYFKPVSQFILCFFFVPFFVFVLWFPFIFILMFSSFRFLWIYWCFWFVVILSVLTFLYLLAFDW